MSVRSIGRPGIGAGGALHSKLGGSAVVVYVSGRTQLVRVCVCVCVRGLEGMQATEAGGCEVGGTPLARRRAMQVKDGQSMASEAQRAVPGGAAKTTAWQVRRTARDKKCRD